MKRSFSAEMKRRGGEFVIDESDVPDAVWMEILSKLPLKTKFRLKCLSKRWYSLVSDTYMGKLPSWDILFRYLNDDYGCHSGVPTLRTKHDSLYIVFRDKPEFKSPNFSFDFLPESPIKVLAASNGLLLCCKSVVTQIDYYVCNPLMAQWVSLPKPFGNYANEIVDVGFISEAQGYKVVRIRNQKTSFMSPKKICIFPLQRPYKIHLQIFTSDTGGWRVVELPLSHPTVELSLSRPLTILIPIFERAVFYNGIMHWLWLSCSYVITAYDPNGNSNQIRSIYLPRYEDSWTMKQLLGVCDGRLRHLHIDGHQGPYGEKYLYVETLMEYDAGEWCMDCKIPTSEIYNGSGHFQALAFHPFHSDIVYLQCGQRIISYNFQTRISKTLYDKLHDGAFLNSSTVFPFVLPPSPTPVPPLPLRNTN